MLCGQQLAHHYPDAEDIDRFQRLLAGALTVEPAYAQVAVEIAAWRAEQDADPTAG